MPVPALVPKKEELNNARQTNAELVLVEYTIAQVVEVALKLTESRSKIAGPRLRRGLGKWLWRRQQISKWDWRRCG